MSSDHIVHHLDQHPLCRFLGLSGREVCDAILNARMWGQSGRVWEQQEGLIVRPENLVSRRVLKRRKKTEKKKAKKEADRRVKGLVKNKKGKYVKKDKSEKTKSSLWTRSIVKARTILGIKGFAPIRRESPLHHLAKAIHMEEKEKLAGVDNGNVELD